MAIAVTTRTLLALPRRLTSPNLPTTVASIVTSWDIGATRRHIATITRVRVRKEIQVARPPAEAFAYVADFSNSAEWDPGIPEARKLTDGPVRQGSEFEVVALFRGKRQRFHYVVTAFDADRRIVLTGEGKKAGSVDEITFEPAGTGTRIVYVADIRLKGIARVAEPLLGPTMNRMGDDALAGLKSVLDRPR